MLRPPIRSAISQKCNVFFIFTFFLIVNTMFISYYIPYYILYMVLQM